MNRYLLSEHDHPLASDYYYEADHTANDHVPSINPHSHNYYEIYMYLSGEVKVLVNDHIFDVQKGDVVIIPPYYIHNLIPINKEGRYERMYLYVTETCLNTFQFQQHSLLKPLQDAKRSNRFHYHIDNEIDYERITYAIDDLKESKRKNSYGKEMLNRSNLLQIITLVNSYIVKETRKHIPDETSSLVSQVIFYIHENFTKNITIESLSEEFFTNRQKLTKLFKEHTALTLHQYITLTRIAQAKQLICNGIQPSKIHLMCGFNDYTTFFRSFKRIEGVTPKQFYEFYHNTEVY